ncbi:MAG: NRDE family protein [Bacteroidota bacterium]
MCLILFAYRTHPDLELVLGANRDEFYGRPTAVSGWWDDHPNILAGRDLQAGGTWMGITKAGRWAAITNYRELPQKEGVPSRGDLVKDYLVGYDSPASYFEKIQPHADAYNGFNLLLGDSDALWYYGNKGPDPRPLEPGIYGLSNHLLDSPWPKVEQGKTDLRNILTQPAWQPEDVFSMLGNPALYPDDQLPKTGVPLEWERRLSAAFIRSPQYGTRLSTVLQIDSQGKIDWQERSFQPSEGHVSYSFTMKSQELS